MGTINLTDPVAGTEIEASLHANNNSALEALLNGGVDDANLEAAKIITGSTHFKQDGASTNDVYTWDGADWVAAAIDSFFTMPGALLGIVEYNPTTPVSATTTSTSGSDVDATNLSLAVTVPSSGKILVTICAVQTNSLTATAWGIRESTSDVSFRKVHGTGAASASLLRETLVMIVTGLSPGAHTYKLGLRSTNAGQTANIQYGTQASPAASDPGPASMSIWAVP